MSFVCMFEELTLVVCGDSDGWREVSNKKKNSFSSKEEEVIPALLGFI